MACRRYTARIVFPPNIISRVNRKSGYLNFSNRPGTVPTVGVNGGAKSEEFTFARTSELITHSADTVFVMETGKRIVRFTCATSVCVTYSGRVTVTDGRPAERQCSSLGSPVRRRYASSSWRSFVFCEFRRHCAVGVRIPTFESHRFRS